MAELDRSLISKRVRAGMKLAKKHEDREAADRSQCG
jgi:DNA invertase Pin-like site-specific DNA recombinase